MDIYRLGDRVRIRRAVEADRPAVWPLLLELATSYRPEPGAFERGYAAVIGDADSRLFVAERDGELVGYVLAQSRPTLHANAPVVWVSELVVVASARRSGIGAALMHATEEWAAAEGAASVTLATRRAAEFYEAVGYTAGAEFFTKRMSTGSSPSTGSGNGSAGSSSSTGSGNG